MRLTKAEADLRDRKKEKKKNKKKKKQWRRHNEFSFGYIGFMVFKYIHLKFFF